MRDNPETGETELYLYIGGKKDEVNMAGQLIGFHGMKLFDDDVVEGIFQQLQAIGYVKNGKRDVDLSDIGQG